MDPAQLFAFGIGDELISRSVGQFKLVRVSQNNEIVHRYQILRCEYDAACRDTFADRNPDALYFVSKIDEEDLKFDLEDQLRLTFEFCKDEFFCVDDPEAELEQDEAKVFLFQL